MDRWPKQQLTIETIKLLFWLTAINLSWGGNGRACVAKSLCPELPTTPPTRSHPVEAECVVDVWVFAGM